MKKVLVIRFSSIGDIVLTSPVVRCLKAQTKGITLHYLTKEEYKPLLETNPNIDKVFTISREKSIGSIIGDLRAENYDFIVDLHKNIRSWQVLLALRKPFGTFSKLNIRKYLICKFKIDLLPRVHIVDRYFHAVRRFEVINDDDGLDYYMPEGTDPWKKLQNLPDKDYVALVIGGKHGTKQLPLGKLIELCGMISNSIVILGGKDDESMGNRLVNECLQRKRHEGKKIVNTSGLMTIHESASLIRAADLVVTHDTGLMHIAAAYKKDIISLWGNTIPAFGMYPYYPAAFDGRSLLLEVEGLPCRPCSKLGYPVCPKRHFRCMEEIDFKEITGFKI